MTHQKRLFAPPGHFYSPLVNASEVEQRGARIWPQQPTALGIDFNDANHTSLLQQDFSAYLQDWDYPDHPEHAGDDHYFFATNPFFSLLDARALFVLMRKLKFKRLIEIGSGFSTLLMRDINHRFLNHSCALTSIDPEPRQSIQQPANASQLMIKPVQDIAPSFFDTLEAGDCLFIDSSHVAKTGSDVNYLYFHVLPRLKPGVYIHIHDIFLPLDYPKNWVLKEERNWNEQYVLQAFLMYNHRFQVYFGSNYAVYRFPQLVAQALQRPRDQLFAGGSLWLQRSA